MSGLARRYAVRRLWRAYFNAPLYVPVQARSILTVLETRGADAFRAELERLAALGSPWAAAILGYMCLLPAASAREGSARAIELCKPHADAGDAYALFVYALALLLGRQKGAVAAMGKAARAKFPPAQLGLVGLGWSSLGTDPQAAPAALRLIKGAQRSGHVMALNWKSRLYRLGHLGVGRRLLGYALMPVGVLRAAIGWWWRGPFSALVFFYPAKLAVPLLEEHPRFPVYNTLATDPQLDERRAFHRYLLVAVHALVCALAITAGVLYRPPSAGPLAWWAVLLSVIPYLISAGHSLEVVSPRRLGVALFCGVLLVGGFFTACCLAGAIDTEGLPLYVLMILEASGFFWAAELLLSDV